MSRFLRGLVLLLLVLLGVGLLAQAPVVQPGARVAILGDSITEQKIYSRFIEDYLIACMPELKVQVMQFGWGGDTANGISNRMQNDLLPYKPTLVTTCYGMNDGGYRAFDAGIGKRYEDPMRVIVGKLKETGATVIVGTPGAVDTRFFVRIGLPDIATVYNDNLRQLGEIDRKIATDTGMPFADVHGPMIDAMAKAKAALGADFPVCGGDGVHPGPDGQLIMAYAFLKAMGFDGNLGAITVDMKGNATATGGHTVLAAKNGVVDLQSTRYPFCFFGGDKDPNSPRSILPYLPFNQDLNRLMLTVKNLDGAQAKVTWGTVSKVFTKADLEKGINLAAEFPDNPFSAAFAKVDAAVATKQGYETMMIKTQITNYPWFQGQFKDDAEFNGAVEILRKKLWTRQADMSAGVTATVVPVKHTLTVEVVAQ